MNKKGVGRTEKVRGLSRIDLPAIYDKRSIEKKLRKRRGFQRFLNGSASHYQGKGISHRGDPYCLRGLLYRGAFNRTYPVSMMLFASN